MNIRTAICLLSVSLGFALASPGIAQVQAGVDEGDRIQAFERSASEFAKGLSAERGEGWALAAEHYQAALEIDPEFVEAMANLARVQLELGQVERAEALLDRAEGLRTEYPQIYAVRGLVSLKRSDWPAAIHELGEASRLAPDDVEALTNLGVALINAGQLARARTTLERAARMDPTNAAVNLNLGIAEDLAGRSDRALFRYQRFLQLAARGDPLRETISERAKALSSDEGTGESPAPRPPKELANNGENRK